MLEASCYSDSFWGLSISPMAVVKISIQINVSVFLLFGVRRSSLADEVTGPIIHLLRQVISCCHSARAGADYTGCTSCFPSLLFLPSHWSRHSSQGEAQLQERQQLPALRSYRLLVSLPTWDSNLKTQRGGIVSSIRRTFYRDLCLEIWKALSGPYVPALIVIALKVIDK